jgi:large subunit ribosomal protein L22
MDVPAIYRGARISAFKCREVARVIQGKSLPAALDILKFTPRKAASLILQTLKSAAANAENNNNLRPDKLFVREATVGEGPTFKRFQPKARGSAGPIRKRTSHIRIILTDEFLGSARRKRGNSRSLKEANAPLDKQKRRNLRSSIETLPPVETTRSHPPKSGTSNRIPPESEQKIENSRLLSDLRSKNQALIMRAINSIIQSKEKKRFQGDAKEQVLAGLLSHLCSAMRQIKEGAINAIAEITQTSQNPKLFVSTLKSLLERFSVRYVLQPELTPEKLSLNVAAKLRLTVNSTLEIPTIGAKIALSSRSTNEAMVVVLNCPNFGSDSTEPITIILKPGEETSSVELLLIPLKAGEGFIEINLFKKRRWIARSVVKTDVTAPGPTTISGVQIKSP